VLYYTLTLKTLLIIKKKIPYLVVPRARRTGVYFCEATVFSHSPPTQHTRSLFLPSFHPACCYAAFYSQYVRSCSYRPTAATSLAPSLSFSRLRLSQLGWRLKQLAALKQLNKPMPTFGRDSLCSLSLAACYSLVLVRDSFRCNSRNSQLVSLSLARCQ
jgi:hypothetical protein